ncbi:hypothetical protein NFI96_001354 [Prochilodus magdalenae]|nr:hypothetical protein NFI96_001354 [Prochilodus magdalenae]
MKRKVVGTEILFYSERVDSLTTARLEDVARFLTRDSKSRNIIENIDACLGFLAAKGVNIKGLCAEEIRSGNLKAILGLFFSLSRFKQQQQQQKQQQQQQDALKQAKHDTQSDQHTQTPQNLSPAQHCPIHSQQQQTLSTPLPSTQGDMQSRLPGPSVRGTGTEAKLRKSSSSRRSQSFNHCDKTKTTAPACSQHTDKSSPPLVMVDQGPPNSPVPPPTSTNEATSSTTCTKGWRSKSLNAKHSATSSILSVKQPSSASLEAPPKVIAQKSMLDKLKLFNSRPSSRASSVASLEDPEALPPEVDGGNVCPVHPEPQSSHQRPSSTSPKLALKGIAQRTLGRALAPKISAAKAAEKEKDKVKQKGKEKVIKRSSGVDQDQIRDETRSETQALVDVKKSSFIPKGTKSNSNKKEASSTSQSGIPKPGHAGKGPGLVKVVVATPCGKEGERSRNVKAGGSVPLHKCPMENKNSSSTSSLASSEGRLSQNSMCSVVQSTACNTASVQLPQPLAQYSHPNTATVAPFMYRSRTDMDKTELMEGAEVKKERSVLHSKSIHTSLESLTAKLGLGQHVWAPQPPAKLQLEALLMEPQEGVTPLSWYRGPRRCTRKDVLQCPLRREAGVWTLKRA